MTEKIDTDKRIVEKKDFNNLKCILSYINTTDIYNKLQMF